MVMFFGLYNSLATFQVLMDHLFRDYIAKKWLIIYMDNLLIHSPNLKLQEEHTKKVLQHLRRHQLYLKLEECVFAMPELSS